MVVAVVVVDAEVREQLREKIDLDEEKKRFDEYAKATRGKFAKEKNLQMCQINEIRAKHEEERKVFEFVLAFSKGKKLTLDVGGIKYQTMLSTVTSTTGTLATFFTEREEGIYSLEAASDGSYFIDRDGELFR